MKYSLGRFKLPEASTRVNLFVVGLLFLNIYIRFMYALSNLWGFETKITSNIYYGLLWIMFIFSLPQIVKVKRNLKSIILLIFIVFVMFETTLHPSSNIFIKIYDYEEILSFQSNVLIISFAFIFIGLSVTDFNGLAKLLHSFAKLSVVISILSYVIMIYLGMDINYDDMGIAYSLSLFLCILVSQFKKGDIIYIIGGTIFLIIAGTRGPIACVLVTIFFRMIFMESNVKKIVRIVILFSLIFIVLYSGVLFSLLISLSDILSNWGLDKLRIVEYIKDGMLLDGSGREDINTIIIEAIKEEPIWGYGVGGDRYILPNNSYTHNIITESFIAFGVFGGILFILWIAALTYKILKHSDLVTKKLMLGLFCGIVIKLLMSGSFVSSKELFLFLGMCIQLKLLYKKEKSLNDNNKTQ